MQRRITRNQATGIRPNLSFLHQARSNRIGENVEANCRECIALSLLLSEYVIVWLVLKALWRELWSQILTEKFHAVALI